MKGYIYILKNPSFPEYVKIGYADDVKKRLEQLNRSECIPFAFRIYATYEVDTRLSDKKVHANIDNGEEIEYYADPDIKAVVVDDRIVRYDGQDYSLTALAKLLSGKKYSIAGPKFFKYNGEWLNDIRKRLGV